MDTFKDCKSLPFIVLICMLAFTACEADSYELAYKTEISDYKNLISLFEDPPSEFRSAPFWIWHEIITEEEIRQSLEDLKEQGFGGVFVHPRYGMVTEYLSEDWFDLFKFTMEVAEELDMYVWIYDENSYPSGFAGGHVPHQMPDSYKHGQALRMHKADRFQPDPDLRYLHYFEKDASGEMVEINNIDERTGDTGQFIMFEIVTYPQTKWYAGYSYVDLLYPGVTEEFMDITMQGYEERFGEHFGKLIPGVFTDEPNIAPPGGRSVVRWTPDLYEEFEKRWGYRLQDNLLSLFEEAGDWKKVRHNHFQLLLQMFIDRWSKPWFEYTEKHQLQWTGHYWEHGWPSPHHGGDNMAMYAWHQIPGIDLLFNTMYTDERPDQFGRIRNVKELRSAANQTGRTRTLSESYGGSGWEITFEDMKRLGDWMYVLGVNFLNQHMTYMTILGDRKTDYPQSFSYHSPWWNLYGKQNDYFARLSVAMSSGKQKNNILVIEPTTSAWMYYSGYSPNENLNQIGDSFNVLLEKLEQHKIAYDLGSENIIKDIGSADKGRFVVGEAEYDLVVLPSGMENIDESTFRLLEHYLESGGKVVSLVTTPTRIDGMKSETVASIINKYDDQWLQAACFTDGNVYDLFGNKRIRFSQPAMQSEWFFHHKRDLDDGRLVFLVNSEPEEAVKGHFQTKGRQAIKLDPHTGDATLYPFSINGEDIIVDFSVKPAGSLLLFISDADIAVPAETKKPEANIIVETQISKVTPLSPNMMILDYGELFIENKSLGNMFFQSADEKVWQHYGYNENPWFRSVQFKTELIDADTFTIDTGFEFVYSFQIEEATDMLSINAVAERPQIFKMSVNGVSLEPIRDKWFLDKDLAVYSIGEHLHAGKNYISLKVRPMSMLAELQPVYITGDFSLSGLESGWYIVPIESLTIGSWKESGFPFYSDRVMYTKTHSFSDVPERVVVQLGDWKGTVAEVRVNNQPSIIIQQPPYQADVTDWLVAGDNKVAVIVYGSNKNIMGPHHNITRRGIVRPGDFLSAPVVQPPGKEYDLLDYGLMEDFKILVAGK